MSDLQLLRDLLRQVHRLQLYAGEPESSFLRTMGGWGQRNCLAGTPADRWNQYATAVMQRNPISQEVQLG